MPQFLRTAAVINSPKNGEVDAFVTELNGQGMTDLNSLVTGVSGHLVTASGINDAGQIIAEGEENIYTGYDEIYLLTPTASPVPEPETYVPLAFGFTLVGFSARRRKHISGLF